MFQDETKALRPPLPLTRGGALDALRFLAAFLMVIHHFAAQAPTPLARLHPVFDRGYLATDFFIVVSGYVMGRIYGDRVLDGRVGMADFFLRRAGRVIPAHLLVSAAFVATVLLTAAVGIRPLHPEWFDWKELPGQIALVQAWGPFGGKGWNAPTWSLSALLACYLFFPIAWRAMRRIKRPLAALALGVLGMAGADALARSFLGYPIYQMPMFHGVVRAAPLFLLGVALAVCAELTAIRPRIALGLALTSALALAGLQMVGRFDFLSLSLIALLVLSAGWIPVRKPSKLLEKAALVSFALFITNEYVRVIYFGVENVLDARLGFSRQVAWLIWLAGPLAAVLFAVGFHYLVDWPSQVWIKARLVGTPRRLTRWLASALPSPDPSFDPWRAAGLRTAPVRELVLQSGPIGGVAPPRRAQGPADLNWG